MKIYHKDYRKDYKLTRIINFLNDNPLKVIKHSLTTDHYDIFLDAVMLEFVYSERKLTIPLICKETRFNKAELIQLLEFLKNKTTYSCAQLRERTLIKSKKKADYYNQYIQGAYPQKYHSIKNRQDAVKKLAFEIDPKGKMKKYVVARKIAQRIGVHEDTIVKRDFNDLGLYQSKNDLELTYRNPE